MKDFPQVFIMGRQNVGKSTLFNAILKKNASITEDSPGITRDVIKYLVSRSEVNSTFYLCDTPGLDLKNEESLSKDIWDISLSQLKEADIILHVIDVGDLRPYDHELIRLLKKDEVLSQIPVVTLINKVDSEKEDLDLEPFFRLGLNEILPVSGLNKRNLNVLFQKLNLYLPKSDQSPEPAFCKIAILGKPNSGKSSLLNSFLGYARALVSDIPGTTRDSVSEFFLFEGKKVEIVDTAGIRKKTKSEEGVEFYSYRRTLKALEEADLVLLLIDATKGFGEFDKKIFGEIQAMGKPMILVVNKWDLISEKETNTWRDFQRKLEARLPAIQDRPMLSISATDRQRTHKLLSMAISLTEKSRKKITTRALNDWLGKWKGKLKVQKASHRPPKVFYATQVSSNPFRFLFFVNDPKLFPDNILSFYRKNIVEQFDLNGLTVEIELKGRKEGEEAVP